MNLRTLFSLGALVSCLAAPAIASAQGMDHGRQGYAAQFRGPDRADRGGFDRGGFDRGGFANSDGMRGRAMDRGGFDRGGFANNDGMRGRTFDRGGFDRGDEMRGRMMDRGPQQERPAARFFHRFGNWGR